MNNPGSASFFAKLSTFERFSGVTDAANYSPLPEDWSLAVADIVGSTAAITAGRYKAVNMAGASVISAILNALGHRDLPFVFGGDGAVVAVPAESVTETRAALSAVQVWVREELGLTLRAAMVPMTDIRKSGHEVRVARYRVSPEITYGMFMGGGASWAEQQMKAGQFAVEPAAPGSRPDLSGLSCRWNPIQSRHGVIASIIIVPGESAPPARFSALVDEVVAIAGEQERGGHPVPAEGLHFPWPPKGLDYEARASAPRRLRPLRKLRILFEATVSIILERLNKPFMGLDVQLYRADSAQRSDFRKFDDGLKMTVDLNEAQLARIESILQAAAKSNICRYGLHRQNEALMTCLVPSPFQRDHMHFIDGADGGYAMAAAQLKSA
ncbi:MAG: DUF3095 domain-containing protein [Rhizobiales bacterium]|nr:DUF3095 domain-containing protein [Hyphomicrobiales bacterium]